VNAGEPGRQRQLDLFQRRIRKCTACVEAGFIPSAMPIFQGNARHRLMIVGQAPAYRTVETPPYSGASGRKLQSWLEQAGFPPDSLYERFYLTSLTKCFPGSARSGNGDRPPSSAEIAMCASHLEGELALVQPEVVLTLGRLAATRFLGSHPLTALVGRSFERDGRNILPLPHPSGVSRWLNEPANQALVDQALSELDAIRRSRSL
jgi:uracil-DNA glycosylase family 4